MTVVRGGVWLDHRYSWVKYKINELYEQSEFISAAAGYELEYGWTATADTVYVI